MSRMAWACNSLSPKRAINCVLASSASAAARIVRITSSMLSTAMRKPSKIWARARVLASSNSLRRRMTSSRCSIKICKQRLRDSTRGWLRPCSSATSASVCTGKVLCRAVNLYSRFSTRLGCAPRRNSITIRMPLRSLSSRISVISSMRPSRTKSAMRSISMALFT